MLFSHTRTQSFDGKLVTLINIALVSIIFESKTLQNTAKPQPFFLLDWLKSILYFSFSVQRIRPIVREE